jgi:hypothetical protein
MMEVDVQERIPVFTAILPRQIQEESGHDVCSLMMTVKEEPDTDTSQSGMINGCWDHAPGSEVASECRDFIEKKYEIGELSEDKKPWDTASDYKPSGADSRSVHDSCDTFKSCNAIENQSQWLGGITTGQCDELGVQEDALKQVNLTANRETIVRERPDQPCNSTKDDVMKCPKWEHLISNDYGSDVTCKLLDHNQSPGENVVLSMGKPFPIIVDSGKYNI